jgi:hypothetical protein
MQFKLSPELTTVTSFSKFLALLLFITLPAIGFLFGMKYQALKGNLNNPSAIPISEMNYPTDKPLQKNKEIKNRVYTNYSENYSFEYLDSQEVKNDLAPDNIAYVNSVYVEDKNNPSNKMYVGFILPERSDKYNSTAEAADYILKQETTSTSTYLSPEANIIKGPFLNAVGMVQEVYTYELSWKNDTTYADAGSGTDVYILMPLPNSIAMPKVGDQFPFLLIKYDKQYDYSWQPLLATFKFI